MGSRNGVEEEVLKIQDKSYDPSSFSPTLLTALFTSDHMEQILRRLSGLIRSAISAQREVIPYVLRDLIELETRPMCLTEIAYDWCSVICEKSQSPGDWESLLLASLEIGFRHLDPREPYAVPTLAHTEHHPKMVDIVFKSQKSEAIADLLHAWTTSRTLALALLGTCTEHLVCLHSLMPFSSRLRQFVLHSVELIGYEGFEGVGVERFVGLLNHLHVTVQDINRLCPWARLLLGTLQTSEGTQLLSHWYWELLVELGVLYSPWLVDNITYNPQIMTFLTEAQEWSKLEYWMGAVWLLWPPEADGIREEDLGRSILLLFRQRPGAFQKLEQWMERWSQTNNMNIPESFQRICKQAQEAAQRDTHTP